MLDGKALLYPKSIVGEDPLEIAQWEYDNSFRAYGCRCPISRKLIKRYKRRLNQQMIYVLGIMYYLHSTRKEEWLHMRRLLLDLKEDDHGFTIAKYWGLIRQKPNVDEPNKLHTGYWQLTEKGVDFLFGIVQIEEFVILYLDEAESFDGKMIYVHEVKDMSFNIRTIMNNYGQDYILSSGNKSLSTGA